MNIWISTDLHLVNTKIDARHPFQSEKQLGSIIDTFASTISQEDLFIFLGDLCDPESADKNLIRRVVMSIPCRKLMCKGNHDTEDDLWYREVGFDHIADIIRLHNIIFSHKPVYVAPDETNIHGHLHTRKIAGLGPNHINAYGSQWVNNGPHLILLEDLISSATVQRNDLSSDELSALKTQYEQYTSVDNDHYATFLDISAWIAYDDVVITEAVTSDKMLQQIQTFHQDFDSRFQYGIKINGKFDPNRILTDEDYDKHLVHQKPLDFEKSMVGVCWDCVAYEAWYFKKHFPGVKFRTYYLQYFHKNDCPSHTILTFEMNGAHYLFECSFQKYSGIYIAQSEVDLLNWVLRWMSNNPDVGIRKGVMLKTWGYDIWEYNALDESLFGMHCQEYMNYVMGNSRCLHHVYKKPNAIYKLASPPINESIMDEILYADVGDTEYWLIDGNGYHEQAEKGEQSDRSVTTISEASTKSQRPKIRQCELVFLSPDSDWNESVISPRIPDNYMTQNGYEDSKTPRVCFSTSISKALRALSQKCTGMELYVYTPDKPCGKVSSPFQYKYVVPTKAQVPDVDITEERWIFGPVGLHKVGKIRVIGDAGGPGLSYTYGKGQTAELYDWEWEWIEKDGDDPGNGNTLVVNESISSDKQWDDRSFYYVCSKNMNDDQLYAGKCIFPTVAAAAEYWAFDSATPAGPGEYWVHSIVPGYQHITSSAEHFGAYWSMDNLNLNCRGKINIFVDPDGKRCMHWVFVYDDQGKAISCTTVTETASKPPKKLLHASFTDVKKIVDSIPKEEHHFFYHGSEFKDSPNVVYRKIVKEHRRDGGSAFIDVYAFDDAPDVGVVVIAATPNGRGHGLTDALINAACQELPSIGITRLVWRCDTDNIASYALAKRHKFIDISKPGSDQYRLERIISDSGTTVSSVKELYHGSPNKYQTLKAQASPAYPDQPVVFATPMYEFALAFAGNPWSDLQINQCMHDGKHVLTEILPNQFDQCFNRPGYVHVLKPNGFAPFRGISEWTCPTDVKPVRIKQVTSILDELQRSGTILYRYPNLPPWIPSRKKYMAEIIKKYKMDTTVDELCKMYRINESVGILDEMAYEDAADLMRRRLDYYCKEFNNSQQFEQIEEIWKKNWPGEKPLKLNPYLVVSGDNQLCFDLAHEINTDNDEGLRKVVTYTRIIHDLRKKLEKDKEIKNCAYIVSMYDLVEDGVLLYVNLKGINAMSADDPQIYWPSIKEKLHTEQVELTTAPSRTDANLTYFNDKGAEIGKAMICGIDCENPYLFRLEVYPRYRGKNYGNAIMRRLMDHYKVNNLSVTTDEPVAIHLFEKFGFKKFDTREDFHCTVLDMKTKDAVILPESTTVLTESATKSKTEWPTITTTATTSTNPNDHIDQSAVTLKFFNSEDKEVGEASISGYNTAIPYLYDLEVYSRFRGQGYGNSIMNYIMRNYRVTQLCVEPDNKAAIHLYKKFGFKERSRFTDNGRELIEMVTRNHKSLDESAAELHQMSAEERSRIAKKYELVDVGNTREFDDEAELVQMKKRAAEKKAAAEAERRKKARNQQLKHARDAKKRKAFVRKLESRIPGVRQEDATAVDVENMNWTDEGEGLFNNGQRIKPYIIESYQFQLLDHVQFFDHLNEAAQKDQKYKPVYVVIMHTGTMLSKMIQTAIHSQYSHASISFDSSLTSMYSFARKLTADGTATSDGGFRIEDIRAKFFQENDIKFAMYMVPCTEEQIKLMKKRLEYFRKNQSKFKYDFTGLIKNYFSISDNPEYKWFCTRFVADILNAGRPTDPYIKDPFLVQPDDFMETNFAMYVTTGYLNQYDQKAVDMATKRLLNQKTVQKFIRDSQNESVIDFPRDNPYERYVLNYQLSQMDESAVDDFLRYMQSFKVRFDANGDIRITRREYDQLDAHFRTSVKMAKSCASAGNVNGVKEELYKIYYMIELINKYYLKPNTKNYRPNVRDIRKDMMDLRAVMLSAFKQYLEWVTAREPDYNFQRNYKVSDYGSEVKIPQKTITQVGTVIATLLK